jgi:isopentenyl-diphosphate delta-isomerase
MQPTELLRNYLILVNEQDECIGTAEKLPAHQKGQLHRALSIFVLNSRGEMLLQQRAAGKYHSGGLWSNACCSHPAPGETTEAAAHRRLQEELGFDTALSPLNVLRYRADVGNGLIENEYDHLYAGYYDGPVLPVPEEVQAYRYLDIDTIETWMKREPQAFTAWFHLAFAKWKEFSRYTPHS